MKRLLKSLIISVVCTVYHATPGQTDSTPYITASGYIIKEPELDKIAAVPQIWVSSGLVSFGDWIYVDCCCDVHGEWQIQDVMNKRYNYVNRIDLLVTPDIYARYEVNIWF